MAKPATYTIENHLEGKDPIVRELYSALIGTLREIGPILEEPKKTSIHLVNHTALAGVQVRKNYLLLNIKSDHKLKSKRFIKGEQLSARRFHQELKLTALDEIDDELKSWLRDAYAMSA